ncbi:MAG TPA: PQQ-binding-like beta-propeller repeat protein [Pirellulales bacterium]|nr:PQQ-binding-like beta-propeller repeat protein [Pirellulales bacterium]
MSSRPSAAHRLVCVAAVLIACARPQSGGADDWPHWRGPHDDGISREANWSSDWPTTGPTVAWRANVGTGFSSIAVANGRAYTAGHRAGNDTIYCFDAERGTVLWEHTYPAALVDNLHEGGPAATPTVDSQRLYTLSKDGQLFCLATSDGKVIWQQNVGQLAGVEMPTWGFSSSVFIADGKAIVDAGRTLALDQLTGKLAWQTQIYSPGYGTAAPCTFDGADCVAVLNNDELIVVRVSDGAPIASHPWTTDYATSSTTPIVVGDRVFISTGYQRGCALLQRAGERFDLIYENKNMSNHMATCVLWNDHLYGFDGNSHNPRLVKLTCLDFATGEVRWSQRGFGCGSLLLAGGKLLILSDDGELVIADADPGKFHELARARVLDGRCWTVPTLANGRLYCRDAVGDLVCLDLRHGTPP